MLITFHGIPKGHPYTTIFFQVGIIHLVALINDLPIFPRHFMCSFLYF